jgi:glycosyltransferase involved in cell wall biosynthesis
MAESHESSPSVLFVVRGDETVPSCRFRAYQYAEPLRRLGVRVEFQRIERKKGVRPALGFLHALHQQAPRHQAVVYQKCLDPARIALLRLRGARVFFDFDDAIYLGERWRFAATMRASMHVLAGNSVLADQARAHNPRVSIVPTTVPLPAFTPPRTSSSELRLSWVGTADNLRYLAPVLDALRDLRERASVQLHVLTERPEELSAEPGVSVERWSREAEDRAFRDCHVGLMPLRDDAWSRGKCACKALQYLSYGRPVISSAVGVNAEILQGREFASFAGSEDVRDWRAAILSLHARRDQLAGLADSARAFVRDHYATDVWAPRLRDLLLGP